MLLKKVLKPLWRKTLGPSFNAARDSLKKALGYLFKTFYSWLKEKLTRKQHVLEYESGNYQQLHSSVGERGCSEGIESHDKENGENTVEEYEKGMDGRPEDEDKNSKRGRNTVSFLQKPVKWLLNKLKPAEKTLASPQDVESGEDKTCDYNEGSSRGHGSSIQKRESNVTGRKSVYLSVTGSSLTGSDVIGSELNSNLTGSNVTESDLGKSNTSSGSVSVTVSSGTESNVTESDMDRRDGTGSEEIRSVDNVSDGTGSDNSGSYDTGGEGDVSDDDASYVNEDDSSDTPTSKGGIEEEE